MTDTVYLTGTGDKCPYNKICIDWGLRQIKKSDFGNLLPEYDLLKVQKKN